MVIKRCLRCGYNLNGIENPLCPECGRPFDPTNPDTYFHSGTRRRPWELFALSACIALFYIHAESFWGSRRAIHFVPTITRWDMYFYFFNEVKLLCFPFFVLPVFAIAVIRDKRCPFWSRFLSLVVAIWFYISPYSLQFVRVTVDFIELLFAR